eukprot:TRINITY_DN431_c0_g1_i2.p1 TRINITY_DN431_c0_g1~~TRINITY_DN431_c0_g1_i2.p1  ORF type:complete len:488 (+),score=35.73 TRINITY_DN431_c0_g1_i2:2649-4112(+)
MVMSHSLLYFTFLGLFFVHYVSASWTIWSLSWNHSWGSVRRNTNELRCKRARHIFLEYCNTKEPKLQTDMSRAFIDCFLNQAGAVLQWDESDPTEKHSSIINSTLTLVDMLCSDDESILQSSLTWFNGDEDISRSLQNLSTATEGVYGEGQRIQKLISNVSKTARQLNSFNKHLLRLRTAYLEANASIIRVPDFAIIHDELWIMVQDTVDLFASHLHMISYFKNFLRNDFRNMENVDKTIRDLKDLSLSYTSYKREIDKLEKEIVRNKAMRVKVLYPWLSKEKRKMHMSKLREASQGHEVKEWTDVDSELRERFRFRLRAVFWLLYDNVELSLRAYVRFAFLRVMTNTFESCSWPNWMLLASTILAHLLAFLSVVLKVFVWLVRLGISLFLVFVRFRKHNGWGTSKKRSQRIRLYEDSTRLGEKKATENETDSVGVQIILHSVCQRELEVSISKLRSVERRMLTLLGELKTLQERAASIEFYIGEDA